MWRIPPRENAAFACAIQNVLEVYHRPYDLKRPVVAMDEQPRQLISETRTPLPCKGGQVAKVDYEYRRHGGVTGRVCTRLLRSPSGLPAQPRTNPMNPP